MRCSPYLRFTCLAVFTALLLLSAPLVSALGAAPLAAGSTAVAAPGAALAWSKPQHVDTASPFLASVSCAGPSFCVAMDGLGNAFTWRGQGWSGPVRVDPSGGGSYLIACPSTGFCAEIGGSTFGPNGGGTAHTWNGRRWSGPAAADPGHRLTGLACASATLCVAVDASGDAVTWNGRTWSVTDQLNQGGGPGSGPESGTGFVAVSCVGPSFCLAVDGYMRFTTWLGRGWSTPADMDPFTATCARLKGRGQCLIPAASLSCAGPQFCALVGQWTTDNLGHAVIWNGRQWSQAGLLPASDAPLKAVSCAGAVVCVALDGAGNSYLGVGMSWSHGIAAEANGSANLGGGVTALSCPTTGFCMAVDSGGNALLGHVTGRLPARVPTSNPVRPAGAPQTTTGALRWSPPQMIDPQGSGFVDLTCPSATFCLASNQDQNLFTWNGRRWSKLPSMFGTYGEVDPLACASATFCMAVGPGDLTSWWNGRRWSAPQQELAQGTNVTLACAGPSFCLILGAAPNDASFFTYLWNGSRWTRLGPAFSRDVNLGPLSCVSAHFCMAVSLTGGSAFLWNGRNWSKPLALPVSAEGQAPPLTAVSCASAHLCMAASGTQVYTWVGGRWLPPVAVATLDTLNAISCPTTAFCVAAGKLNQFAYVWNGQVWTRTPPLVPYGDAADMVSCASPRFCVLAATGSVVMGRAS